MNLNQFFQVSVSVFSVVATIFILVMFVWGIMLFAGIRRLIKKVEEISEIAKTTTGEVKSFIERTIEFLDTFKKSLTTLDFIRKTATDIINLIKNKKGTKDE